MTAVKKKASAGSGAIAGASGGASAGRVDVKSPFARFSTKRVSVAATKHGHTIGTVERDSASDRAKIGSWIKFTALKSGVPVNWGEADEAMVRSLFATETFSRVKGRNDEDTVSGAQARALLEQRSFGGRPLVLKGLLDDSVSGGIEIAPIFFDDRLITYPVLTGEISPYVDIVDVPRGRRIEGGALANPNVIWGTTEGASITPFNTSQMVSAIDTNIFNCVCAVEVGNDFLADSGVDVAGALVEQIGQKFAEALDSIISVGDGAIQPLGIINDTISNAVNSDSGLPGPATISDLESLYFSVKKQYRQATLNPRLLMNDVTYKRFRSIPVGPTDARRVMGMGGEFGGADGTAAGLAAYMLYGVPVSIGQQLANNQVVFGCMKKYRLYRRLGIDINWFQEGEYLALRNLRLLVVRMRVGGRIVDGNAFGIMSDAAN